MPSRPQLATPSKSSGQPPESSNDILADGQKRGSTISEGKKRRKHRGGKKRKNRRQSFAAPSENSVIHSMGEGLPNDPLIEAPQDEEDVRLPFYRRRTGNLSDDSLDSEALLDHR